MSELSGPMFEPSTSQFYESIYKKDGAHYNIYSVKNGMDALRDFFPDSKADSMNFVLFSTSGVHGSLITIEEVEKDKELFEITFLIVQPRICCLRYGNCEPKNEKDFIFLKALRKSSWEAIEKIGGEK